MFKLDQAPDNCGLRCDASGLFLGHNALLQKDEVGNFQARSDDDLRMAFGSLYGGQADWDSRIRSVNLVAKVLNAGDMARAMMAAVLMRLPDPNLPVADTNGVLAKAGFNPDEPRDERGRWTNGGNNWIDDAEAAGHTARTQHTDAGFSDASDDPVAQAASRAAAAA